MKYQQIGSTAARSQLGNYWLQLGYLTMLFHIELTDM